MRSKVEARDDTRIRKVPAGPKRLGRMFRQPLALGAAITAGLAALIAQTVVSTPPALAGTGTTTTFSYTGGEQQYTVPTGATALTITAIGAPGGTYINPGAPEIVGGDGAVVTATVPVTALPAGTTTLDVEVGGAGSSESSSCTGASGGFNGGGASIVNSLEGNGCGGGGGGASDVRTTSITAVPDSALTTANDGRLVVAGGGGGGGAGCDVAIGGAAGDTTVTGAGFGGDGCVTAPGNGGFGAPAGSGGIAQDGVPGVSGALGQGGGGQGAGGGGYYGGGGGSYDHAGPLGFGGGGGGSSYWVPSATSTSMSEDTTGVPEVEITPIMGYQFSGFFSPISNTGLNVVKAGQSIPVQFSLGGDQGLSIFATGYPASIGESCNLLGQPTDNTISPTDTAGGSGLQYDPTTNTYTYVWKTAESWSGTCRQLQVTLNDGTTHTADFEFK